MAHDEEKKDDSTEGWDALKNSRCHPSAAGEQTDECTKTTKAVAEHVGRVCGHDMKQLVSHGTEASLAEPVFPEGDKVTEAEKAIWSEKCDAHLKKADKCEDYKAKDHQ